MPAASSPRAGPPGSLSYAVSRGTAACANASGSGTIAARIVTGDLKGTFAFVLHSA